MKHPDSRQGHRPYDTFHMGRSSMDLYSNDVGVAFVDIKSFAAYVGLGNACGAMVASRHGCSISISFWEETMAFVRGQGGF